MKHNHTMKLAAEILNRVETRKLPVSSLTRIWSLGSVQAKILATYLIYGLRCQFVDSDRRQELKNEANLTAALRLLGTMGYLRGAIMKVGQLLGHLPHVVPAEFVEVLESLHFEAPPMHYALICEVFLDEFGKQPEELYATFERRAFAAASLGQVHRATLHDGTQVAVKIQYPNIGQTIRADMKSLRIFMQSIRFRSDFQYIIKHLEDAQTVFEQEIDYLAEARFMAEVKQTVDASKVVVPKSFDHLSSRRVLTMEYLPGRHLKEFLAEKPSQEERNHFGDLICYAFGRTWFMGKTVYADVHPGNFLFMPDGRLGFIDFGCFRRFSEKNWHLQLGMEKAFISGDREQSAYYLAKMCLRNDAAEIHLERMPILLKLADWIVEPILAPQPFNFLNNDFIERGMRLYKDSFRYADAKVDPFYNWSLKGLLGLRFMLYRLEACIDYGGGYFRDLADYHFAAAKSQK